MPCMRSWDGCVSKIPPTGMSGPSALACDPRAPMILNLGDGYYVLFMIIKGFMVLRRMFTTYRKPSFESSVFSLSVNLTERS